MVVGNANFGSRNRLIVVKLVTDEISTTPNEMSVLGKNWSAAMVVMDWQGMI